MNKPFIKRLAATTMALALTILPGTVSHADSKMTLTQLSGSNARETATIINNYALKEIKNVYIASNSEYADALTGGVLAAEEKAALVYAEGATLDASTKALVEGAENVYILGGNEAVSDEIAKAAPNFKGRIYGEDRYETAVAVAEKLGTDRNIVVVSGETYADALSAAALGGLEDRVLLLTNSNKVSDATKHYLEKYGNGKDILFVGGFEAVSNEVKAEILKLSNSNKSVEEASLYGRTRYATSLKVADRFGKSEAVILTNGYDYRDALAASSLSAVHSAPIVLVAHHDYSADVAEHVNQEALKRVIVLGGFEVIDIREAQSFIAGIIGGEASDVPVYDAKGEVQAVLSAEVVEEVVEKPAEKPVEEPVAEEAPAEKSGDFSYSKVIDMSATAYDASYESNGPWGAVTAMGTNLRPGVVAVDRKVIPLGTKLYIESTDGWPDYGFAVAEDVGGAIKGNKIDLFYESSDTVYKFGRRNVKVYVLD